MPARRTGRARPGARNQRADGKRARPARLLRSGRGARVSSTASSRRTIRSCSATWRPPATRIRAAVEQGGGSASTATTTSTASRRRRSPYFCCASSGPRSTGTCRAASTRGTACAARRSRASPTRAAGSCHRRLRDHRRRRGRRGEGARARRDRHRPPPAGETLPDCPIVATRPSGYPFPELCGTGVVYKLGQALFGVDSEIPRRHLDLVALATIADVVPLVDENRSLAIAGLRALARTAKPGLRALMRAPASTLRSVDAGAVGFRLGPPSTPQDGSAIRARRSSCCSPRTTPKRGGSPTRSRS